MRIAEVVATRSTCLHRLVGAVIVKGKQVVSTGYNGAAAGHPHCLDIGCARAHVPSGTNMELCRGAHAEQNAINFAARYGIAIEGASLYCTAHPAGLRQEHHQFRDHPGGIRSRLPRSHGQGDPLDH